MLATSSKRANSRVVHLKLQLLNLDGYVAVCHLTDSQLAAMIGPPCKHTLLSGDNQIVIVPNGCSPNVVSLQAGDQRGLSTLRRARASSQLAFGVGTHSVHVPVVSHQQGVAGATMYLPDLDGGRHRQDRRARALGRTQAQSPRHGRTEGKHFAVGHESKRVRLASDRPGRRDLNNRMIPDVLDQLRCVHLGHLLPQSQLQAPIGPPAPRSTRRADHKAAGPRGLALHQILSPQLVDSNNMNGMLQCQRVNPELPL
mmetsp:Transcript_20267/g.46326  ORF Transcript_20267/g.46326 Transcript_20267/m.46326 type:complete len:256 (+) Transcript_20267:516-1283(+)